MCALLWMRISWKCLVSFLSAELHYVVRIVHIVVIVVQFRRVERVNANTSGIWLLDDTFYAQEVPEYKAYIEFQKRFPR